MVDGRWRRRRKEQEDELLGESYRLRSAAAASTTAAGAARRRVRPVTGPMRPTGEEEEEEGNAANGNGEANGGGLRKFAKLVEEVRKMEKIINIIACTLKAYFFLLHVSIEFIFLRFSNNMRKPRSSRGFFSRII